MQFQPTLVPPRQTANSSAARFSLFPSSTLPSFSASERVSAKTPQVNYDASPPLIEEVTNFKRRSPKSICETSEDSQKKGLRSRTALISLAFPISSRKHGDRVSTLQPFLSSGGFSMQLQELCRVGLQWDGRYCMFIFSRNPYKTRRVFPAERTTANREK